MSNSANETATSCTCTYLSSPVKLIKHTMKLNKAHLATSVVEWQRFKLTCLEMVPGSKTKISFTDESVTCLTSFSKGRAIGKFVGVSGLEYESTTCNLSFLHL